RSALRWYRIRPPSSWTKIPQLARSNGGWSSSDVSRCASDPLRGRVRGGAGARLCAPSAELMVSDARISFRIEQVRQQVDQHEYDRHKEDTALDRREVPPLDRREHVPPHARPGEDRLGEQAARQVAPHV